MRLAPLSAAVLTAGLLLPVCSAYAAWAATGTGSATAAATVLPEPGVSATCTAVNAISVTWTVPAGTPVAVFTVDRSTDGGLTWSAIRTVPAVTSSSSYTHTDPALAEATYVYRVTGGLESWTVVSPPSESRVVVAEDKTGKKADRQPASCT